MDLKYKELEEFIMKPIRLSEIADEYGFSLVGPDIEIVKMVPLHTYTAFLPKSLSWAYTTEFLEFAISRNIGACFAPTKLKKNAPEGISLLLTDQNVEFVFYTVFCDTVKRGYWNTLESEMGKNNNIASTAIIHDSVVIGNDCHIMDYAVILPNTRLGNGVIIEHHTTIGLDGLQTIKLDKHKRVAPHVGGLWIEDGALIGASSVIRRELFGNYTYIGKDAKIGPLSSVGHAVVIGARSRLVNTCMVAGSAIIGENVRVAPSCSILQQVELDDYSFIGLGSVVTRSIPSHALAYGSPAKVHGWVCVCENKLNFQNDAATCVYCGSKYLMKDGSVCLVK